MKFGLENIRALLGFLGNPQREFATVHIAGTNGKGSTAAMIAAVLTASGYKTGLYTSPHLVRFTERIRINGKQISEGTVSEYVRGMKSIVESRRATFFETTTAMAFRYFADEDVDVAVIEAGLGGRLDATNVLDPLLTIITSIGFDHTDILGKRLETIAREKGGILKVRVPCLVGDVPARVKDVITGIAAGHNADVDFVMEHTRFNTHAASMFGTTFDIHTPHGDYRNLACSLPGKFQKSNIALSIEAVGLLKHMGFNAIRGQTVREGLLQVRRYTGLRGRLECISTDPLVIADVAHNPDAMQKLVESLLSLGVQDAVVVIGVMADKDVPGIARQVKRLARICVAVAPNTHRAAEPCAIMRVFHALGSSCVVGGNVRSGVRMAYRQARKQMPILVTGSHYVVGEFLADDGECT